MSIFLRTELGWRRWTGLICFLLGSFLRDHDGMIVSLVETGAYVYAADPKEKHFTSRFTTSKLPHSQTRGATVSEDAREL